MTLFRGVLVLFVIAAVAAGGLAPGGPSAHAAGRTRLPSLSISDALIVEPATGSAEVLVTVHLSRPVARVVRVRYRTQDGTALAGSDYVAAHGTVVFKPKQRARRITIDVLADNTPEDDEAFYVILSKPRNARVADDAATVTIPYNQLPPPFTDHAVLTTLASPDAHGIMVITCDPAAARLSYTVTVSGLPHDAFELHIHPKVGQPGGHLINLTPPPANGTSSGTYPADRALLLGLYENPHGYFAAVHEDPAFPAYTLEGDFSRP